MRYPIAILTFALGLLLSCKDDDKPTTGNNPANNEHTNVQVGYGFIDVNGQKAYVNSMFPVSATEQLRLRTNRMYLSNIALRRADGTWWKESNSYHLMEMPGRGIADPVFTLSRVPAGSYTAISFGFGVDSTMNRSVDKKGDLDPANGMAWDWNTGYRFLVMEGADQSDTAVVWHIGEAINYRIKQETFAQPWEVKVPAGSQASKLVATIDISKFLNGPVQLTLADYRNVMFNRTATAKCADNIIAAISIKPAP